MSTFYYIERPKLHVCSRLFSCTEESYEKLKEKGKIMEDRKKLLFIIQKYRLLTLAMIAQLTGRDKEQLVKDLDALSEYGLLVKQFFEGLCEGENVRSETFYCAPPTLPQEMVNPDKKNEFVWSKDIRLASAMSILSFNQFHIALLKNVPGKALQSQIAFMVRKVMVDGRYRLKGRRFFQGYSHMIVLSVRDFSEHNKAVADKVLHIKESYSFGTEKMPWIVLLCENKEQCAHINLKLKQKNETAEMGVYFLLDTDIEFDENPLHILQTYRYGNNGREIVSETFRVEDWF